MARDIIIKSVEDIAMSRRAAQLAAAVLAMIEPHVVPGVSTDELDRICHDYIVNVQGITPANVGYLGYPKTILTSVNQVVCHGIQSVAHREHFSVVREYCGHGIGAYAPV